MPLGMEVGLGPGHIVLDGIPASPPKKWHLDLSSRLATTDMGQKVGAVVPLFGVGSWVFIQKRSTAAPTFRPMSIVAKRLESLHGSRCHFGTAAPTFQLMSIMVKRSPISATAELLFNVAHYAS